MSEDRSIQKRESKGQPLVGDQTVWIPPGYELVPEDEAVEEAGSHLWDYVALIWRRRWWVAFVFCCSVLVAAHLALRATPLYEAWATLEIRPETITPLPPEYDPSQERQARPESNIATHIQNLQQPHLMRRVVQRLDLYPDRRRSDLTADNKKPISGTGSRRPGFRDRAKAIIKQVLSLGAAPEVHAPMTPAERAAARERVYINYLLSCLNVQQIRGTQLAEVRFLAPNPATCADIANAVCDEYISWTFESRDDSFKDAIQSVRDELASATLTLESSVKELQTFVDINGLPLLADDPVEIEKRLEAIRLQLNESVRRVFDAEQTVARLDTGSSIVVLLAENPLVQRQLDRLNDINLRLASAATEFGDAAPQIKSLKAERAQLERLLETAYGRAKETARVNLRTAEAERDFIKKTYDGERDRFAKVQGVLPQYEKIKQELEMNRQLRSTLQQRLQQLVLLARVKVRNIIIGDRAERPLAPTYPNKARTVALGALIGLFLGIAIVLFLEYMDWTVKGPEEVERTVHLPTLGFIPHLKNGRRPKEKAALVTHTDPQSPVAESFRYLRTSILYSLAGRSPKTILVTSPLEGEGKTTIATNLAVAFAQKGKRVLLLDGDLSRPGVHKCFEVSRSKGLTEILTGKLDEEIGCDASDPFRSTEVRNLFLLPSGSRVPNPVDLLDSDVMRDLLVLLGEEYDHIVIDSAPLMARADTSVLVPYVDGVVLVVRPGKTPRTAVRKARDRVSAMQGRILGVVLSNPRRNPTRSDGYGYGYLYGAYADQDTEGDLEHGNERQLARAVGSETALPPSGQHHRT